MKKITLILYVFFAAITVFAQKTNDGDKTVVIPCSSFHVTRPLSEIFAENPVNESLLKKGESEDKDGRKPQKFKKSIKDGFEYGNDPSTVQTEMGDIPTRAPIANFAGQSTTGFRPMDPSGAIGPNHYVQMINSTTFKVFNKTTGANMLTGTFGTLFGLSANDGDPVVLYDKAADRWFMSQFGNSTNKAIYIAISKTNDPTGAYYTYTYTSPAFPDYLKFSVWQDGYYMTSNQAQKVFCFERTAMLAGTPTARSLYTSFSPPQGSGFFVPLPGDAGDGTLPAAGTPCPIFSYSDNGWGAGYTDAVNIYKMTVNWVPATPTGTIASAGSIPTAAFDATYSSSWDDCPQPGTTQKLDGIGGVCNFRAQWKTWTGYNTVVLNWAVKISATQRSIKWCELRQNQSTGVWSMYQEGIYAPDAATRWLGSIAMDNNGAIALAYLKSDATSIYPSLCYTGRRSCDALGTLPITEVVAKAGAGSQTGVNRVGDYSQTTLDPSDGITFWHTGEYMAASGVAKTQVYSFQLTTCATAAAVSILQTTGTNPSCSGASNTFTATPTNGGTAPSYQWQVNGANVGTNSPTFTTTTLTNGQVVTCIMTSNLAGVTNNPATSNAITMTVGLLTPTISIAGNNTICAGASTTFTATITNGGTTPVYQWKVNGVNAGTNSSTFTSSSLTNGQTITCVLTSNATCLSTTTATSNTITMVVTTGASLPFVENFELATFPPTGWSINNPDAGAVAWGTAGAKTWVRRGAAGNTGSTSGSAGINYYDYNTDTTAIDELISKPISLSGATNPKMTFKRAYHYYPANPWYDQLRIFVSTDCGATYGSALYYKRGVQLATNGWDTLTFTPTVAANWDIDTVDLSAYVGQNIIVKFAGTNKYGNNLYLDDININNTAAAVASVVISSNDADNIICAGTSVTFTATPTNGGTAPTYQWKVGATNVGTNSATFTTTTLTTGQVVTCVMTSNLAGVTGSPATSNSITMTVNPKPVLTITNPAAVCSPGTIDITAASVTTGSTGSGTLTYWTNAGATTALTAPNAVAASGTYYIKSTTAAGCVDIKPVTVTINPKPVLAITNPGPVCSPGTVDLTAAAVSAGSTGSGTLTYWTDAATTATLASPAAVATSGTYYIKSTTAVGCIDIKPVTVTINAKPTSTFTQSANQCLSGNAFTFTNTGSTGTYSWTFAGGTPSTSATNNPTGVTFAAAGTHAITHIVTSAAGCVSATTTSSITIFAAPTAQASTTTAAACGVSNGSITLGATTGGTSPYSFSVDGSAFTTSTSYPGLAAANHSVIVKDANGCQFTTTVTVPNSSGPTSQASTTNNSTCGSANGIITLGATTGGTGPYTFSVDGSGFTTSTTYSSLASGSHSVIVKDANGCQYTTTININNTFGPTAQAATTINATCGMPNGSITLGATTGGTAPYSFLVDASGFTTSTTYTGLAAGTHSVVVKDANGCQFTTMLTIANSNGPTALSTTTTNSTCGGADGSITIGSPTGGTGPYTYSVDGSGFTTATSYTGLTAGNHSVIVKDANGCTYTSNVSIGNTGSVPATPTITLNGSALTSSSAIGNQWYLNGVAIGGATNQNYTFTANGNYTVIVTTGGCSSASSSTTSITNVGINELTVDSSGLLVYPNPNDGNFTVSFFSSEKSTYTVEIFNALGQVVVKDEVKDFSGNYSKQMNVVEYGRGVYTISLTNSKNETVKKIIVY